MSNQIKNNIEYDLIVIGAGSGGVRAARIAANYGAKVAIVESVRVGGTCVLRGCVPKKLLVYGAQFAQQIKSAEGYGWSFQGATHDWNSLIKAKNIELDRLNKIYMGLLSKVDIFNGYGDILSSNEIVVGDKILKTKNIIIAVGGKPFMPNISGVEYCIDSDQALDLPSLPKSIVIYGGGYIALEFAGIFNSLGSKVTLIYRGKYLLRGFDEELSHFITEEYEKQNIKIVTEKNILSIEKLDNSLKVYLSDESVIETNQVLMATGRVPNTTKLSLLKNGIETGSKGQIIVNNESKTTVNNIYAIGDVTDRANLTPVAIAEGHALADNLFGGMNRTIDYKNIASAVFSQPAIGVVGLNETEAIEKYKNSGGIKIYKTQFKPMKETLGGKDTKIFMKMIVSKSNNKIIGIHGVGDDMPEIIQICAVAIKMGATKQDFDETMGIHPTAAEELVTLR